jgi:hypothetical protein
MPLNPYYPFPKTYWLLVSIFLSAAACAALSVGWGGTRLAPLLPDQPALASSQSNSPQQRVETERVTLRPTGFDPAEITRPQGEFILAVDNLSGLREVTLLLERGSGEPVRERRATPEQFKWKVRLDLRPGRYVLREAGHPEWACALTVTPK